MCDEISFIYNAHVNIMHHIMPIDQVKKFRKKRKGAMDYNEEIPFEKRAPVGFFPTLDEKQHGR